MTTYRPGDVYTIPEVSGDADAIYPADLVGAQPIWSDDSDTSYAAYGQTIDDRSSARADFDPVPVGSYTLLIRAFGINPGASLFPGVSDHGSTEIAFVSASESVPSGWSWWESSAFDVSSTVAAEPMVFVHNGTAPGGAETYDLYVSEVILRSVGSAAAPPCRLFPRSDRLGNTPRLFPPPNTRQSRNRFGPY